MDSIQSTTKTCPSCKTEKSRDYFSRNACERDGLQSWCKACQSHHRKTHKNPNRDLAKARIWNRKSNNRPGARERAAIQKKIYAKTEKGKEVGRRARKKHAQKANAKARTAVMVAVRDGILPKVSSLKCSDCRDVEAESYHHESYGPSQWLVVVPLCNPCHYKRHGKVPRLVKTSQTYTQALAPQCGDNNTTKANLATESGDGLRT